MTAPQRIVIVGAGISGLSTAYFLTQQFAPAEAEIALLESSWRCGGLILTEQQDGFLLEGGPDSFLSQKPEARELCEELRIQNRLIESNNAHRQVYIFSHGKLEPLSRGAFLTAPIDRSKLLTSRLLSWRGRWRAALEPFVPASGLSDESVEEFVRRRLGREFLEKIAAPLVAGIYGGDSREISVRSAFPQLFNLERTRGRITDSSKDENDGTGKSFFISLQAGMGELVNSLLERIGSRISLRLGVTVAQVSGAGASFIVRSSEDTLHADHVILCTPAHRSARLLLHSYPQIAGLLSDIPYTPAMIVCLGYRADPLGGREGSGFLVPQAERKQIVACTWACRKFPYRCPEGKTLLRCFISGSGAQLQLPDDRLVALVSRELQEILGIQERPILARVYRWDRAMPQYTVGHHSRIESLIKAARASAGLYCVGNFLDGVGIPDCIRHARNVARSLRSQNSF